MNAHIPRMRLVETDPQECDVALFRQGIDELEVLMAGLSRQRNPELDEIASLIAKYIRRKRRSLWSMRRDATGGGTSH